MDRRVNLLVLYYSMTGGVYALATAAAAAAEAAGAEVRVRKVPELAPDAVIAANEPWAAHRAETAHIPEVTHDDLIWADAYLFGTPTRFGLPAAQVKQFIDTTGGLWAESKMVNKIASSFTSTATAHGGQESTILAVNNVFYHWGCIIVPPGYVDPVQFMAGNPYGGSHTSSNGTVPPNDTEIAAIGFQARRMVEICAVFLRGWEETASS